MKTLVYHPTGNQNVRALLRALSNSNQLHSYHTTIACFEKSFFYKFLVGPLKNIKKRTFPNSISNCVVQYPFIEILLMLGKKTYKGNLLTGSLVNKLLAYDVAKYVKKKYEGIDGVFGFPFGSEPIFLEAKKHGILCVYEQATAYYKALKEITDVEKNINPDWAKSITIYEEPQEVLNKLDRELETADIIVVASSYIKKTLIKYGYPSEKINIIPYGYPQVFHKQYREIGNSKLRILFAGNISQLKGLSYLFAAVDGLEDRVCLTLVGAKNNNLSEELEKELAKHNYIGAISHKKLLLEMRNNDLLIFPSLCDGFGMVVTEAMSQGTPVIASENSCSKDLLTHGENGWIVPIQNSESIRNIILDILKNPHIVSEVGKKALSSAELRPWEKYEYEIAGLLKNRYDQHNRQE